MKRAIIMAAFLLILFSCEMGMKQGKVVFVSVAIDYGAPDGVNALPNPPEDQRVLSEQIEALAIASGEIYEEYLFLEKHGDRTLNGEEYKWNSDDVLSTILDLDTVSDDLIIFHYSGHGDDSGALVTDIDQQGRLGADKLLDTMKAIDGRKCLFLDSCYSGSFITHSPFMENGEVFNDGNLVSDSFLNAVIPSLSLTFSANGEKSDNIWVLSAATSEQLSFDSWDTGMPMQENFGAFSYYLAIALGYDMENDSTTIPGVSTEITFYGLYQEIKGLMATDLWREATPQVTLSHYDPVLFRF